MRWPLVWVVFALSACGSSSSLEDDGGDAGALDVGALDVGALDVGALDVEALDAGTSTSTLAAGCVSQFGRLFTAAFGRLDGTLVAVVAPADRQCTLVNNDHLVLEIAARGGVMRVVVNILSDGRNGTDTRLRFQALEHEAVGPPFAEGWHPGVALDYPSMLDAHSTGGFVPTAMPELIEAVESGLVIGAPISAYATSSGGSRADSAHLVHRNNPGQSQDGALVVRPTAARPTYLLFHFDGDVF
jgi:hypothetical protein